MNGMICSQIYAALFTVLFYLVRANPGQGGGGGAGGGHGGGVGGHGGGVGAHGGGAGAHGGGGGGGIFVGRPYYGHGVKRDVYDGELGSEGDVAQWPVYRDYYYY
jgi:hypothetical protein